MLIDTLLPAAEPPATGHDARTRDRVLRCVAESGPVTASALARELDLTAAAIRRHLDALVEQGLLVATDEETSRRGRGRPARAYVLTSAGHRLLVGDDDVATAALHYLADQLGPHAVLAFARDRLAHLEQQYLAVVERAGSDPIARAKALAEALVKDGYAASTTPLEPSEGAVGLQLRQGHCPMYQVAEQFPQFCTAETEAFARLLGVGIERQTTLASGKHVCTTFVPSLPQSPAEDGSPRMPETTTPAGTQPETTKGPGS